MDIKGLRKEYANPVLTREMLDPDPYGQFERWFQAQGYETRVLPSTSPAYTLAFPRKVDLWRAAWPELSDSA